MSTPPHINKFTSFLLMVTVAVSATVALGWIVSLCQYGIDITDEGMHLTSIANPFNYKSITQFGFFYFPLYQLFSGDVVLLRIANLMLLVLSGAVFINALAIASQIKSAGVGIEWRFINLAIAVTSLVFLNVWQPTPSYNTLNLIGLLFASTAVIRIYVAQRAQVVSWVLLGVAAAIVFITKASSAVIHAISTIIFLAVTRRVWLFGVIYAGLATCLVLVSVAIAMDGSIAGFVDRIVFGLSGGRLASGEGVDIGHLLWHGRFKPGWQVISYIGVLCLWIVSTLIAITSKDPKVLRFGVFLVFLSLLFCLLIYLDVVPNWLENIKQTKRIFIVLSLPLSILMYSWLARQSSGKSTDKLGRLCLFVFLVGISYGFAIGTNSSYYYVSLKASIFIVGASLVFLPATNSESTCQRRLATIGLFSVCITFLLIQAAVSKPHRQPPGFISDNTVVTEQSQLGARLKLQFATEKYFSQLSAIFLANGFVPNHPMIDLTGASPGVLYAMGAKSLGAAWLIGGYDNSFARATHGLNQVDKIDLERAWLLVEVGGRRSHNFELLALFDKNLMDDYRILGQVTIPKGLGGRKTDRTQIVYAPLSLIPMPQQ